MPTLTVIQLLRCPNHHRATVTIFRGLVISPTTFYQKAIDSLLEEDCIEKLRETLSGIPEATFYIQLHLFIYKAFLISTVPHTGRQRKRALRKVA